VVAVRLLAQLDADFPGMASGESMLERVGDELVDDQATRDRRIEAERNAADIAGEPDRLPAGAVKNRADALSGC
jgi:hypothetical protein